MKRLTKCDFCKYKVASGCSAKENSYYCREANTEFYNYLAEQKKKYQNKRR